jgi:hypothetical protein
MRFLEGGNDMSNDALRLALRQELCGGPRELVEDRQSCLSGSRAE